MDGKKVASNALWIISARIVQALLQLVISILTARYLGPSNFGLINYASAITAFALPIMQLGLTSIVVQEVINNPKDEGKILGTSIFASFISAIMCIIGIFIFVSVFNSGETETIIVTMLYSTIVVISIFEILRYWFQAKLLSKYTSIISLVAYIIVSIYKVILLVNKGNIRWFAVAQSIDVLVIAVLTYIFYKKLGGQKFSISFSLFKEMFKKSKYYIISGLMVTVFSQTDKVMLKLMINEEATGLYSTAISCAGITAFVFAAIIDSMRPLILESKGRSEESFNNNMSRLYSIVIYLALLQSIFITILAGIILYIMYGEAYLGATNALRIVVWYTTFAYIGSIRNIWILANNKQHCILKIDISGALLNVVLNFLLIPRLGIEGAALASLLTQIFSNVIMVALLKDVRPNIKLMGRSLNPKVLINTIKDLKGGK